MTVPVRALVTPDRPFTWRIPKGPIGARWTSNIAGKAVLLIAPVLIIPRLLDEAECRRSIAVKKHERYQPVEKVVRGRVSPHDET